ncbi:MAG: FAD-dependent oxidoreductase [Candidatus Omnitrophica bacterium]|nr:FAD-dependent oxidoreductase [Candidatus Omnitrophota bacterium]
MGDIVVIGAGFAGLEAVRVFSRHRKTLGGRRIILVDTKRTFDFLPILPDFVGGRIARDHAVLDVAEYLERLGVNFENGEVASVDMAAREVRLKDGHALGYEYLLVCCGSVTNFYGASEIEKRALKLDSADDAAMIQNTVVTYPQKSFLIVGGGYTGIEIATNIARLLKRRGTRKYSIHVVERQEDILMALPEWMRDYCRINLCRLRIQLHAGVSISQLTENGVTLSNGLRVDDCLLIWAAGVQTPGFVRRLPCEQDPQGRLKVDRTLSFSEGAFAAGDAASFVKKGRVLRMAIQFSLNEGHLAAENILRLCAGRKKLKVYRPLDLGYLVPMANFRACGTVLRVPVRGFAGWVLHYMMCIYRSLTLRHRLGIVSDILFR